jgi:hypothetical protein
LSSIKVYKRLLTKNVNTSKIENKKSSYGGTETIINSSPQHIKLEEKRFGMENELFNIIELGSESSSECELK